VNEVNLDESGQKKDVTRVKGTKTQVAAERQLKTSVTESSAPGSAPPTMNGQPINVQSTFSDQGAASKRDGSDPARQLEANVVETAGPGPPPTFNGQAIHVDSKSSQTQVAGKRDAQSTSHKPVVQESIYEAQLCLGPTKTTTCEGNHPPPCCKKLALVPKKVDASTKKDGEPAQLAANVNVEMKASQSDIKVSDSPDQSRDATTTATVRDGVPLIPCNMASLHLSVVNDRKPCDPVVTSNVDIKAMGGGLSPVVKEEYARRKSDVNHLVVVHDENADRRSIVKPNAEAGEFEVL